jgi:hypothetical protein
MKNVLEKLKSLEIAYFFGTISADTDMVSLGGTVVGRTAPRHSA